jgi:hypothetical protein
MEQLVSYRNIFQNTLLSINNANSSHDVSTILTQSITDLTKITTKLSNEIKKSKTETISSFSIITIDIINIFEDINNKYNNVFEVNYAFAKFINKLFNITYFDYICLADTEQIPFLNTVLNLLENIRGNLIYQLVIRKLHLYMQHIYNKRKPIRTILLELIRSFSIHHSSNHKTFNAKLQASNASELCGSDNSKEKEQGINELVYLLSSTGNFAEQFELLYLSAPDVLIPLLKEPSDEYRNAYSKFGNLLCTLLFPSRFRICLNESEIEAMMMMAQPSSSTTTTSVNNNNITYINDNMLIHNQDIVNTFSFLRNRKYELTYQKELLELNEKVVEVCLIYVNAMLPYNRIFPLQFICYLILRRIYFTFPKYKKQISDAILKALDNLCKFQGQFEWNTSVECRQFAYYLLAHDKDMSTRIKSATAVAPYDIRYDNFILSNANLTIGFNNIVDVDARGTAERKIEVYEPESLVYISYTMEEEDNKEINIKFSKYDTVNKKWVLLYEDEGVSFTDGAKKIVIYVKESGLYRIVFDNTNSWIYKRKMLYRVVFMKPIDDNEDEDEEDYNE